MDSEKSDVVQEGFFDANGIPDLPMIDVYLRLQIQDVNDAIESLELAQRPDPAFMKLTINV